MVAPDMTALESETGDVAEEGVCAAAESGKVSEPDTGEDVTISEAPVEEWRLTPAAKPAFEYSDP